MTTDLQDIEPGMKISIITATYNSGKTIADTLDSVAAQRHDDIEHVVIDGQSSDDTLAILDAHSSRIARLVSEPDRGIYDAMNKGIGMATGDVIGLLNSDDVFADRDSLREVATAMQDPDVDCCYGDLVYVDSGDLSRIVRYWKSRPYEAGLFRKGWVPPHPTFYVRRHVYERFGGFDLSYRLAADFELMLRLLVKHQIRSVHIPKVLVKMRLGGATNQSLTNIFRQNVEIYRSARQHQIGMSVMKFVLGKIWTRSAQFLSRPGNA